jgi:hypothetical protein
MEDARRLPEFAIRQTSGAATPSRAALNRQIGDMTTWRV